MTVTEAKRLLHALAQAQCNTTEPLTCRCALQPSVGFAAHFDEDVVQVVAQAIHDVLSEREDLAMDDLEGAALALLEEGIAGWEPPARQAHRQAQWLEACHRELRGYTVGVRA